MSDASPSSASAEADQSAGSLPVLRVSMTAAEAKAKLSDLARRGKLPGFDGSPKEGLFAADAHGTPFDRVLIARADTAENESTLLRFNLVWKKKAPAIMLVALIATIWPGWPLTDSLLQTYGIFHFYQRWTAGWFDTWMWYLPMTVIPAPFIWRGWMRRSTQTTEASAREQIETMGKALGAETVELH